MAPASVKSPILPSGNVPLSSFLGPLGMERESPVMGAQAAQLPPPGLQGLTTSILGSVISRLQKPKQAENGPPASGVSVKLCLKFCKDLILGSKNLPDYYYLLGFFGASRLYQWSSNWKGLGTTLNPSPQYAFKGSWLHHSGEQEKQSREAI